MQYLCFPAIFTVNNVHMMASSLIGMCGRGRVGIGKDRSVPVALDELMFDLDVRTASATKIRRELLY